MTKILVVGLGMILAAAGSACADGTNSQSSTSSATSGSTGSSVSAHSSGGGAAHSSGSGAGAVAPARSSGSGSVQQGAVAPRSGAVPVVRQNPTNVNVQNRVPANVNPNWRFQRPLDRSELLARQSPYHRNWLNLATIQGTTQSTANTGQVRRGGQVSDDTNLRMRRGRDAQNASPDRNATNGVKPTTPNTPMQATNSGLHTGKPVLNFNNANTMNFTDACRRHLGQHDCNWWRNHCHTIILIGGGFYAWDLGYWYPAYGYDSYYSNYAYDGPIYGYDGLPPDQIIANVQYTLQQLGYFSEAVDGVLGPVTRAAIEDYQVENNLPVTGAIDRPLLVSLGFIY
jgi:peptidoglycan hydrolase-like protein with peptidoglycan-binding domain